MGWNVGLGERYRVSFLTSSHIPVNDRRDWQVMSLISRTHLVISTSNVWFVLLCFVLFGCLFVGVGHWTVAIVSNNKKSRAYQVSCQWNLLYHPQSPSWMIKNTLAIAISGELSNWCRAAQHQILVNKGSRYDYMSLDLTKNAQNHLAPTRRKASKRLPWRRISSISPEIREKTTNNNAGSGFTWSWMWKM